MDDPILLLLLVSLVIISFVGGLAIGIGNNDNIDKTTLNSVCQNITGNETAIAKTWNDYAAKEEPISRGQLVCEIPKIEDKSNIRIIGIEE